MNQKNSMLTVLLGSILVFGQATAANYSNVYAFGDSLSDAGDAPWAAESIYKLLGNNCDPFHPCPPYAGGHYTNGPVAVEYAAYFLSSSGANAGGFYDFAVGGSTTGIGNVGDGGSVGTPGLLSLPGIAPQIQLYLSIAGQADANGLYILQGGANDMFAAISSGSFAPAAAITAADNIAAYATILATTGAEHILVSNLVDLSLTPEARAYGSVVDAQIQQLSILYNTELAAKLADLNVLFPSLHLIDFDHFALSESVFANPGAYGLSNVTDACLVNSVVCSDPSAYAFWDSVHPTTALNVYTGAAMMAAAVPLPPSAWLFALGLASVFCSRKIRQAIEA